MTDNGVCPSRKQQGELKRYGAIAIFALATIIILVAAWGAFSHNAGDLRDAEENDLLAISDLKRAAVESHIAERIADGRVVAQRTSTQTILEATTAPAVRKAAIDTLTTALDQTREAYGYRRILLLDAQLKPVAPAGERELSDATLAAITASLGLREAALVDLVRNGPGDIAYGVVVPVFDRASPQGAPIGAVYLELDARRHLFPLVTLWPTPGDTAESILYRRSGDNILALSPLRHAPGVEPMTQLLRADDLSLVSSRTVDAAKGAVRGAVDYRRVPVLAAIAPIKGTPWTLVSKIDLDDVEASINDLRQAITALAAIFVLLAGSMSYLTWKTQHQQAELRRAGLAREMSTSIEISTDGFVRMDSETKILDVNSSLCAMTGYTREELLTLSLDDVEGAMPPEVIREKFALILAGGPFRFQTKWKRKDGSLVDIDVSTVAVNGESGRHVIGYLRDMTDLLANSKRLERINHYHGFLSRITRTLGTLRDPGEILSAVCTAAVADEHFRLAWAGLLDFQQGTMSLIAAEGSAAGVAREMIGANPGIPMGMGPIGDAIGAHRIAISNRLPDEPHMASWRARLAAAQIQAAAYVPIVVNGRVLAVFCLYADSDDYFDPALVSLLEETARGIALAWESGLVAEEAEAVRARHDEVQGRYQNIFDASPVAIQIHSAADGRLIGINRAHEEKFGYTLAEYADLDGWFEHAYPDPVFREKTRADFMRDIETTRAGGTTQSEELTIRCKNGRDRIAVASVSTAGNDVIVSWSDLTEVRHGEQLLRESEKRFRGMVEQSISGFYVAQDGRITYANRRLADILGRTIDEVIGHDAIEFVAPDEREKVAQGRRQLVDGVHTVSFEAGILRKDGERIVVGVTAAPGLWDDKPASFAIVEDITERSKSADRLAHYVKRLETSMRGTLNAVARMVDLRDPYTAGHQRRVGLIAADIARELGWDAARADTMELIGLVHDIGKIAVPAELLSKPSRLTATEFELIKGHAQASYDILKDVQFDVPVADIIVQHHERLDGSGYPRGLKGDEISPEGRVLAVADVLESMASHRPYRPALGIEAALAELDRNRDTFYDGNIVDTVKHMVHDKGYQLPQ